MKSVLKLLISSIALSGLLAGCGDGGSFDFDLRLNGTLSERQGSATASQQTKAPVAGRVCVFGQCGDTDASGNFNFEVFENFQGGSVLVSVRVGATDSEVALELPGNTEEVRMALSVDQSHRNLAVDSFDVVKTK